MTERSKSRSVPKRVREALLYRAIPGPQFASKVYAFKSKAEPDEIFDAFPALFARESDVTRIHGELFPKSVKDLFDRPALFRPTPLANELAWAAALCRRFGPRLAWYVKARARLQRALLSGAESHTNQLLSEIAEQCGTSVWLLQVQLAASQLWGTPDARHKWASELEAEAEPQSITRVLIRFLYRRGELLRTKEKLREELAPVLEANENYAIQQFLKDKILNPLSPLPSAMASVLLFEAQSSLIDLYEALVRFSQVIATDPNVPSWAARSLVRALRGLNAAVHDERLRSPIAAISGRHAEFDIDAGRALLIELFQDGRYKEFLEQSNTYIDENPEDIALLSLRVRAALRSNTPLPATSGLVGEVSGHLQNLMRLSDDAYGPALSIFALAEQFAPFDWAKYLHMLAFHEVRDEELEFPTFHE